MPIPQPGSRGPRRARADDAVIEALIVEAKTAAAEVEEHQAAMGAAAARRRAAIRGLHDAGLSVRAIAQAVEVAPATVQNLLRD